MPDLFDFAQEADTERNLGLAAKAAARAKNSLAPVGVCHYCETEIAADAFNQLFCNIECRNDYDKELKQTEARGKYVKE